MASGLIFVVGIPRSGTTRLHSLIAEHPDCLLLTPDMVGIPMVRPSRETALFCRGWSDEEIRSRIENIRTNRILVGKTAGHFHSLPDMRRVFPEVKIALIRRERADVIHSMLQRNPWWSGSPKTLEAANAMYERAFEVQEAFTGYDVEVSYEELWYAPVKETERIYEALGLDPAPARAAVKATHKGRNLPPGLKRVFRVGTPGQGKA